MSSITFHTRDGEARVRGMERAMANMTCSRIMCGLVMDMDVAKWLPPLLPDGHYLRRAPDRFPDYSVWEGRVSTWLRVGDERLTLPDGRSTDPFEMSLNTAILLGNDVVRFMARLHGQCEVHGYVAGPNRRWLADIIRKGRQADLLREGMGWEAVITLLEATDVGEVVTSYSVCDTFPNPSLAGLSTGDPEDDPWERFGKLSAKRRWNLCMDAIRAERGLEWRPDDWATIHFGDGLNAISLPRAATDAQRSVAA